MHLPPRSCPFLLRIFAWLLLGEDWYESWKDSSWSTILSENERYYFFHFFFNRERQIIKIDRDAISSAKYISNHFENYHIVCKVQCNYLTHGKKIVKRGLPFKVKILNNIITGIKSLHYNVLSSTTFI